MATDVARLSYDPARRFTGVVAQQGRVSLEAEQNEQRVIDAEERRLQLLDIVGPAGTPDNGYQVSDPTGSSMLIGAGTMYVGGMRVQQSAAIDVSRSQSDWLDGPASIKRDGRAHVMLTLTETDVTAAEDPALYEVALGGPDGTARTRLLQHIEVLPTDGTNCASALAQDHRTWLDQGLSFDPATMRLNSRSRLGVTWQVPTGGDDPCAPAASGGYLGAENQLIRVQVTGADPDAGTVDLVWGYDDASMLYAVTPAATGLVLQRRPVDDYHWPRTGQAMQLLRSTAALTAPDGQTEGYVAAHDGLLQTLTAPYDPDTRTVPWPMPLPPEYADTANPRLFLRAWEQQLVGLPLNAPADVAGTGLQVTLYADGGTPHVGDFWCIGVRPGAPTVVYPERLLRAAQPPDGPRMWACPLAVVGWEREAMVVLDDCRHHFVPLVDIEGGCCTIEVTPRDAAVGRLQAKIDSVALGRSIRDRSARITVCFKPGLYLLEAPIELSEGHSRITLEGCSGSTILAAADKYVDRFGQGLIVLVEADDVTITGMELRPPLVPQKLSFPNLVRKALGAPARPITKALLDAAYGSIGIRSVDCAVLTVSECLFRYVLPPRGAADKQSNVFAAGIYSSGDVWGARITRNEFLHDPIDPVSDDGSYRVLAGYLVSPLTLAEIVGGAHDGKVDLGFTDGLEFSGNRLTGMAFAALVIADQGAIRVVGNNARSCYYGIWLTRGPWLTRRNDKTGDQRLHAIADDPVLTALTLFAGAYPAPAAARAPGVRRAERDGPSPIDAALIVTDNDIQCATPRNDQTGFALAVDGTYGDRSHKPSVTVGDNRLVGPVSSRLVSISDFEFAAVTGNVCAADRDGGATALMVFSIHHVVITGNVVHPQADLPANRPFPAPFDTWLPLNTIG